MLTLPQDNHSCLSFLTASSDDIHSVQPPSSVTGPLSPEQWLLVYRINPVSHSYGGNSLPQLPAFIENLIWYPFSGFSGEW